MNEMLREAGVDVLYHAWASNAVMDGQAIKGVVVIFVILLYSEQVRNFIQKITAQRGA